MAGVVLAGAGVDSAGFDSAGADAVPVDGALPPRKSVTYQPVPFSWKPAAVSCLRNDGCLHDSHTVSGASEIFCNTSLAKPQASQR